MKSIRFWFLSLCILAVPPVRAQDVLADSTALEWRSVNPAIIDQLNLDQELNYLTDKPEVVSIYERILALLYAAFDWFMNLLSFTDSGTVINILYFLSTVIILYLIWKLFLAKYDWIFSGASKRPSPEFSIDTENIHSIDFDSAIEHAIRESDYRLAVRLLYLRTLKLLSDNDLIIVQEGKTNSEYISEIRQSPFGHEFTQLSYHFNYLWYGHFEAGENNWKIAEAEYEKIKSLIGH